MFTIFVVGVSVTGDKYFGFDGYLPDCCACLCFETREESFRDGARCCCCCCFVLVLPILALSAYWRFLASFNSDGADEKTPEEQISDSSSC